MEEINYEIKYKNLIDLWKTKTDKDLLNYNYLEKHHILPKCLGGTDDAENIVKMDAASHLEAHILLLKLNPDNLNLLLAVNSMLMASKFTKERSNEIDINNIDLIKYSEIREKLSLLQKGKYLSEDHRQKLRKPKATTIDANKAILRGAAVSTSKRGRHYGTRVLDTNTGIVYRSLEEAGKALGYCASTISYWIRKIPSRGLVEYTGDGYEVSRDYSFSSKPIIGPDGTVYSSIRDCSRKTGHQRKTITNWIKNQPQRGYKYKE